MSQYTRSTDSRLIIGLLFLLLGVYFLLNNFNLIPFSIPYYLVSWQTLLIVIGVLIIATSDKKGGGITLVIIGGVFLLSDIFNISFWNIISQFWPLVFVIIGVSLLIRRNQEKKRIGEASMLEVIDESAVFSGNEKIVSSDWFRGGRITSIFGGNEINLMNSRLAEGVHVIDVFVLFGGMEIVVPSEWNVKVDVSPILGGFEDKRQFHQDYSPEAGQQLIIRGQVIMGGGEIRNA
ncbi:MAG: LiaI-LiaF-like domain-containing protein [Cyclobacteriaceae bacterium]